MESPELWCFSFSPEDRQAGKEGRWIEQASQAKGATQAGRFIERFLKVPSVTFFTLLAKTIPDRTFWDPLVWYTRWTLKGAI
jgi:hypothetical protein